MKKEVYPAIDIAKFVMAILVVAIHVRPFGGTVGFIYNDVIARIADPLFFALSSFFLFQKAFSMDGVLPWKALGQYMLRIGGLYGSWVLIYSPVIVKRALYVTGGGWDFAGYLLRSIFLSGPYGALWFLTALLLAVPLTFAVAKCIHPAASLILSCPFFVFLVLELGYTRLAQQSPLLEAGKLLTQNIFIWLWNGLTFGFFFCSMGMWAAYRRTGRGGKPGKRNTVSIGAAALLCFAGMFAEAFLIRAFSLGTDYAATFCMIPFTWFFLQWLLSLPSGRKEGYVFLRKVSILIFTIHYGVMEGMQSLLPGADWYMKNTTLQYLTVLCLTLAMGGGIYSLSRRFRCCAWMKHLY